MEKEMVMGMVREVIALRDFVFLFDVCLSPTQTPSRQGWPAKLWLRR